MESLETVGVQRLTLRCLNTRITKSVIVGIIIGKQKVKVFPDKKNGNQRAVWNFTLRDSLRDYINVTYWGNPDLNELSENFHIGNTVDIINAKIDVRHIDDYGEQFRPAVTSPFNLILNDKTSHMIIHEGDSDSYLSLLHHPTKPLAGYLSLSDIHKSGDSLRGEYIDLLVAVKAVRLTKSVVTKTQGNTVRKRDVVVMDQTNLELNLTLWDNEYIQRADHWKPRDTILFLADMKVEWSAFQRRMVAVFTTRTIITENPVGFEAESLKQYARTIPLQRTAILEKMASLFPDPSTIQTTMTTQHVTDKAIQIANETPNEDNQQFTALLYGLITDLDLDGYKRIITTRCVLCDALLNEAIGMCINIECPAGSGAELGFVETKFDIQMKISDHQGTLENCRLTGTIAEKVLGVTVNEFLKLSDDEKARLKWKFLMERCAIRIVVMCGKLKSGEPLISVVSCELANPLEVAAKIPYY